MPLTCGWAAANLKGSDDACNRDFNDATGSGYPKGTGYLKCPGELLGPSDPVD